MDNGVKNVDTFSPAYRDKKEYILEVLELLISSAGRNRRNIWWKVKECIGLNVGRKERTNIKNVS